LDTVSLQYLTNTKPQIHENNSLSLRIKVWGQLFNSWLESPWFGYGPNKAFIYKTKLYPENEYLFYLWRYGVQGLLSYLAIFAVPLMFLFNKIRDFAFLYFVIIVLAVVASMNNPLSNPKISVLFALILGFSVGVFYNFNHQKKQNAQ
jgi:O-antigen ligase